MMRDPARFRARMEREAAVESSRKRAETETKGVQTATGSVERRLPGLGPLGEARWTAQKTTLRVAGRPRPVTAVRLRGYARLGEEKRAEFANYPWKNAGPEFQPDFAALGTPAPQGRWQWSAPFTANLKPPGWAGELYFEPGSGFVYFDIEGGE